MEARGVEPLSENLATPASTGVVVLLRFAVRARNDTLSFGLACCYLVKGPQAKALRPAREVGAHPSGTGDRSVNVRH
ncbi:protein of unknown function [Kyrpidia spormannii]|uniref:Uncharacterized protein n=1 Tax=Kyrpidia spormannii TaxID=2055160 RepID=A0A6F9E363_9BACL|nr:protein of unknown function [Kyrpidia spormannii]